MTSTRTGDRRKEAERRQGGERRRQSEAKHAVFEVCRSMLHLVLIARSPSRDSSPDRVVTRSIKWRKEATSLHSEQGREELAEAFRNLVAEERLGGAKARVALGGEYCVTRVVTGATEDVRREFAELEERSPRYLTLGPGPKTLAGNIQQLDARHQHALIGVANQRTLEMLMTILSDLNLQIESIEPSLIALSRAQAHLVDGCRDACLVIQVDEDIAELGICHNGRLLLDYRPGGRTNAGNVAGLVAQHLSRLQRYVSRHHNYLPEPLRHVYLAGDPQAVARAYTDFVQLNDFQVHILQPATLDMNWQHAAESPGTDLVAALGAAIALYDETGVTESGPNLIADSLAKQKAPIRPILIRSVLPFAAVFLVAATVFLLNVLQGREVAALRAELERIEPGCARATELRLQMTVADQRLRQLEGLARQLVHPQWERILERISQSMPDDVWLDRVAVQDARAAVLSGASYTDDGLYDFVSYLKQVPDVEEIALEGTGAGHSPTGPTTNFTLQVTLANSDDRIEKGNSP